MSKRKQISEGAINMLKRGFVWSRNARSWDRIFGKLFRIYDDAEIAKQRKKNDELLAIIVTGKHGQFAIGYAVYNPCILPKENARQFRQEKPGPRHLPRHCHRKIPVSKTG